MTRIPDNIACELFSHRDELNDILWYIKVACDKSHSIQDCLNEDQNFTPDSGDLDLIDCVLRLVWRRMSEVSSTLDALKSEVSRVGRMA